MEDINLDQPSFDMLSITIKRILVFYAIGYSKSKAHFYLRGMNWYIIKLLLTKSVLTLNGKYSFSLVNQVLTTYR